MTTMPLQQPQEREDPGKRQAQAANPMKSHWVGASAGTGKTKVLIDRVLRLMLPRAGMGRDSATLPGKILCLTFTKTAAAEMSNRIYEALSEWSIMDDEKLRAKLHDLLHEEPTKEVQEEARRLFARVLDTPGGLKIMTIHSFCQSVLKRFPIEANLPPHFELMDEQNALAYLKDCLHRIIADKIENPNGALAGAFDSLTLHLDSSSMSDLMSKVMSARSKLSGILKYHGDDEGEATQTITAIYDYLGVTESDTEESILASVGDISAEHEGVIKQSLHALLSTSKSTDQKKAKFIQPWLDSPDRRSALYGRYRQAFFTGKGEILKTLATKDAEKAYPEIKTMMQREAERLQEIDKKLQCIRLAALNKSLMIVAAKMVGKYERYKRDTGRLDYEDLILRTCDLLSDQNMVQWVLFKLDEGIDHILVDEAQDTSPYQWQVIESLSAEFFAGEGSREDTVRTLFVVGDEKQSIFSFQGADPAAFAHMNAFFGERVEMVQEGWDIVLEYSFRSTHTVLELVDNVFNIENIRKGVAAREVRHLPFRAGHAGLVELWPLCTPAEKETADPWQIPAQIEMGENAASMLARKMAVTIKQWLDTNEILESKNRPIRAGDILILVQSRGAFVETLMRALKEEEVPVAGIDRMTLIDEIAVMDLLAMAQFALLPRDDLTLATVLKSPFVGMTEETLYDLCQGRSGVLWNTLKDKHPDITAFLEKWVRRVGKATPYEFFAEILATPCFADSISGRRGLYARLGDDIHDALDEFLNAALHYEQSHTPSIQKFVDWFMRGESEIKREPEQQGQDLVRIMTAHGSKGLQAPIVFMPDTVKTPQGNPKARTRLIWPDNVNGVPLWSPRSEFDVPVYAEKRDAINDLQGEEYRRLLYVAMTRAEDRLYIAGFHGMRLPKEDCWYNLVGQGFSENAEKIGDPDMPILRMKHSQTIAPKEDKEEKAVTTAPFKPLEAWALTPPAEEAFPPVPLAPSKPGEDENEPAMKGPLEEDDGWKFRRGIVLHGILEFLPQIKPEKWALTLKTYLARASLNIPEEEQIVFAKEILNVLEHKEFAPIFGAGSKAEVPVVGMAGKTKILSGQIDRILVTDTEILIIDYKTNRPPPKTADKVAIVYLKQMAAYRSVIQDIYPDRSVKCALLWTDGPFLMALDNKQLDPYMPS